MTTRRIEIELVEELWQSLEAIAESLGNDPEETALIGLSDWIARRKAELDDRNPSERYFINEALDELAKRPKQS